MAAEDRQSLKIISEESSPFVPKVHSSNRAFDSEISKYPANTQLLALALKHSQLSEAMTISASVPQALVAEASQSFQRHNDNEFDFKLCGKTLRINKKTFCDWLKIPIHAEYEPLYHKHMFDCVNQMGHEPPIHATASILASHIPEEWMLLYHVACNLCGKCSGSGKINLPQLTVLYALYSDTKTDVGSAIFEQFLYVNGRRLPQIFFHRFWSVIVAESLKRFKDYTQAPDAQIMPILVMSLPGVKKATIKFPHVGQIPFSMLANIPHANDLTGGPPTSVSSGSVPDLHPHA